MTMAAGWIPAERGDDWLAALQGFDHGFAYRPEYAIALAQASGHRPGLWTFDGAHGRAVCPLVLRSAPGGGWDIATPLGFGGFAIVGDVPDLHAAWTRHWRERGALSAYVQLSPMHAPESWLLRLPGFGTLVRASRECWVWDLQDNPDALQRRMAPKHRQLLRKWQRGVVPLAWDVAELEPAFVRLYADFVGRRGVPEAYRLPPASVGGLLRAPGVLALGARDAAGDVEAVTIFLSRGDWSESFLNAATPAGRRHSRGLYWLGALALRERGVRWMNLGGGVSDGDSLSDFKQRLGATPVCTLALAQVFDVGRFATACAAAGVAAHEGGRFPPWLGKTAG